MVVRLGTERVGEATVRRQSGADRVRYTKLKRMESQAAE